mmetsp:Transcript_40717/g.107669  ORF Transcript_40717/g.107669 Transcript_40717/m.107669 type:complete len:289 (+) Transcript_40717:211-1077(+)
MDVRAPLSCVACSLHTCAGSSIRAHFDCASLQGGPDACTVMLGTSAPTLVTWWPEGHRSLRSLPDARGSSDAPDGRQGMKENRWCHPQEGRAGPGVDERFVLVCCMGTPIYEDIASKIAKNVFQMECLHVNMSGFARWLFKQERGCLVHPRSILVSGFREAKPCMSALRAAYSGDASGLRPDAQRPQLAAPLGQADVGNGGPLRTAVGTFVIMLDSPARQWDRAMSWLTSGKDFVPGLDVFIVDSTVRLRETLNTLVSNGEGTRLRAWQSEVVVGTLPHVQQRIHLSF